MPLNNQKGSKSQKQSKSINARMTRSQGAAPEISRIEKAKSQKKIKAKRVIEPKQQTSKSNKESDEKEAKSRKQPLEVKSKAKETHVDQKSKKNTAKVVILNPSKPNQNSPTHPEKKTSIKKKESNESPQKKNKSPEVKHTHKISQKKSLKRP